MVGPNGGGKSTAVRAIVGSCEPNKGTIQRAAGLQIGYLPQRSAFPRDMQMTVRAMLRSRNSGTGGTDTQSMLDRLGFPLALLDTQMADLSDGERQRVKIARAHGCASRSCSCWTSPEHTATAFRCQEFTPESASFPNQPAARQ